VEIVKALKAINPDAAKEFVQLYLGNILEGKEEAEE
jgi:hypothetical protein